MMETGVYYLNIDLDVKIAFGYSCVHSHFHSTHLFILSLDQSSVAAPPPCDIGSSVISNCVIIRLG